MVKSKNDIQNVKYAKETMIQENKKNKKTKKQKQPIINQVKNNVVDQIKETIINQVKQPVVDQVKTDVINEIKKEQDQNKPKLTKEQEVVSNTTIESEPAVVVTNPAKAGYIKA